MPVKKIDTSDYNRYIKSGQDTRELRKTIDMLEKGFEVHNNIVHKNTIELAKMNAAVEAKRSRQISEYEAEIKKLQTDILHGTQWIKNEEPALKVDETYMLKKLDIL